MQQWIIEIELQGVGLATAGVGLAMPFVFPLTLLEVAKIDPQVSLSPGMHWLIVRNCRRIISIAGMTHNNLPFLACSTAFRSLGHPTDSLTDCFGVYDHLGPDNFTIQYI